MGEKKEGGTNRYVIHMMRLYGFDLGDDANSGGVPLPEVTIYDSDGEITDHFEECDLYAKGGADIRTKLKFPALPIAEHRPANLEAEKATWMDWGPYMDGQLSYRHVFRENPQVAEIAAALGGETVRQDTLPYVPRALRRAPGKRSNPAAGGPVSSTNARPESPCSLARID